MIEAGIDQFDRQGLHAEFLGEVLVAKGITADAIPGEQSGPAKEGVACSFEVKVMGKMFDGESMSGKPGIEMGGFTGANFMPKLRAEESILEDKPGIGREHKIRQTWLGRHCFDANAETREGIPERMPLDDRPVPSGAASPTHPRIDLVFDAVVVGGAHQDSR